MQIIVIKNNKLIISTCSIFSIYVASLTHQLEINGILWSLLKKKLGKQFYNIWGAKTSFVIIIPPSPLPQEDGPRFLLADYFFWTARYLHCFEQVTWFWEARKTIPRIVMINSIAVGSLQCVTLYIYIYNVIVHLELWFLACLRASLVYFTEVVKTELFACLPTQNKQMFLGKNYDLFLKV